MNKPTQKPKGLNLFCRMRETDTLRIGDADEGGVRFYSETTVVLDADQLDKLAERCKEFAKYLRTQKRIKPVPPKKWEDI